MLQGMSDYSKKQQTTEQLDDWLASNKGRTVLFLPFAGMIVYGIVLVVRDLF